MSDFKKIIKNIIKEDLDPKEESLKVAIDRVKAHMDGLKKGLLAYKTRKMMMQPPKKVAR